MDIDFTSFIAESFQEEDEDGAKGRFCGSSAAGIKEESTAHWPGEREMYHKVVGGECGLRFFFFFYHPVSPRLHAALLRWRMNAEAAQFACQHAFLLV